MRAWAGSRALLALVGLAFLAGWVLCGPAVAAEKAAPPAKAGADGASPAAGKSDEGGGSKIEKTIATIQDRLMQLQNEEFQVSMEALKIQQAGQQGVDSPDKARDELAKGNTKPEYRAYKQALITAASKWQNFDARFAPLASQVKGLEREREKAPADVQAKIDDVTKKVMDKHRSLLERIADLYEKCADYRDALQAYQMILKDVPQNKLAAERPLREKIAGCYKGMGDFKTAFASYKAIFDGIPEKDRMKDKKIGTAMVDCLEKMNDLKDALELCKALLAATPGDKDLTNKVAEIEKKGGGTATKGSSGNTTGTGAKK